jgi:Domain of unknown function (DUF4397)
MRVRIGGIRATSVIVSAAILLSLAAGDAVAATRVRLLHALPGGPPGQLEVRARGQGVTLPATGFGKATEYLSAPAGTVALTLVAGRKPAARASARLADGSRYTVVAERGDGPGAQLRIYRDGAGAPGGVRWRVVHAAPELGSAEVVLDGRARGQLDKATASPYRVAKPGAHRVAVRRPGGSRDVVERSGVNFAAGTAQTAYVVGSGGEPTRFVVLQDGVAAPERGPATGLGGLSDGGRPWAAAFLAALAAGALGGLLYARAGRRRRARI